MTRLEKIVAEQQTIKSKLGDWGIYTGDWNSIAPDLKNNGKKLVDDKSIDVVSFLWWIISENSDFQTIASNLYKSIQFGKNSQFSTGKYIYVINEKITGKKSKGKPIEFWPVYIVPITSAPPNSTYKVGTSPVLSMEQYELLLKKQAELVAAKEKADAEAAAIAAAEKNNPAIEKTIVAVQNVINGTATIDVNNLGKGTPDAKAFQELLYQVGLKLIPTYKAFKKFAYWRTRGTDGGWDGDIGPATLNMLDKLSLLENWESGDKVGVIKDLQAELLTNESTNYFKGTGMNIKLKDLLREQIVVKPDDEVTGSGGSSGAGDSGGGGNTPTPTNDTGTPDLWRLPANYTGKGTITYNNGNTYTGDWVAGKYNGQGTFSRKDGMSYTGAWLNGKYNGQGTYTWPNGNTYTGNFQNNLRNGDGKFYNAETKTTTQQTWKDGEKLLGIDDLYTQSVTNMSAVLLQLVNYVNNHEQFAGYKSMDDDEAAALIDLVKPWVQSNIQPKVTAHYNKYIKPYMSQYNVSDAALTVEYDEEFVGTNDSVTNIQNDKFRKMIQNYLVLEANSSDTALDDPATSAAYYNYAGDKSSYTIPAMFYWNKERSVHYWSLIGGRALFNVDTDF
jgi:hypothetical protein